MLAQSESVFALSNGHIGLRGNLDEGEPFGLPGTYLNGFYETRPLPYAEAGYGYPEDGQTVVNATNGKLIRLLVDDEPFDIRYGELLAHTRTLDLRAGELRRDRPLALALAGARSRSSTTRIVSFVQRSVAAIRYEVKPIDGRSLRVVAQSELVANEPGGAQSGDPRAAAALRAPLQAEEQEVHDLRVVLVHRTKASGLRMAAGMDHVVERFDGLVTGAEAAPDLGRVWLTAEIGPDTPLRVHQVPGLRLVEPALAAVGARPGRRGRRVSARRTGWDDARAAASASTWTDYWERADVEIEGDGELQQAVRFALFHTLQAGARAERRAIPAKGLTGPGYDGHVFWDTETFVLPLLTYTHPDAVVDALLWRHATLDLAMERAQTLRLEGAAFPWRTIRGHECSAYWPAGTGGVPHQRRHRRRRDPLPAGHRRRGLRGRRRASSCSSRRRGCGARSAITTTPGAFHIDGVTGPDEYSAVVDDNVYTNLMAEQNLRMAAEIASRHPDEARGARRRRGGDRGLARRGGQHARPVRPAPARPPAGRGLHPPRADGLRRARVPAAAALSVLPALQQAGGQAAGPRARAAAARRPLHGRRRRRATSPTTSR